MEFLIFLTRFRKKSDIFENSNMSEKLLDVILTLLMIQYGNRVVDVEWVIKLNKQVVSEKRIFKLLKLIIL